jgi:Skp family chaperone for outer membrane proteins
MKPVMDRIRDAIEAVRVEGGYTMILDAASGAFLAADPSVDVTTQVLARLRAE